MTPSKVHNFVDYVTSNFSIAELLMRIHCSAGRSLSEFESQ